jgi:carboxyl-terminal processing protease
LIDAPTVRHEKLLFNTIGYLRIAGFDYDTALEMKKSIQKLEKNGAKSLVIDLRCNGGGIMSAAIDAVRLFINQGTIVTVHSAQDKTEYRAGGNFFDCFSLPLVILVDKNTASAAEIFTAALKDHHRAFVIGEKTLGKGVVQTVLPLSKNSIALCLTTASFIPPCQKSFHKCGIEPDILAKIPDKGPKNALFRESSLLVDDPVLHKGICLLNRNDFDEKLKSVSTF